MPDSDNDIPEALEERDEIIPGTIPAVRGGPLREEELAELRALIRKHGNRLAAYIGMHGSTVDAIAAGHRCRTGTIIQYRQSLAIAKRDGALPR